MADERTSITAGLAVGLASAALLGLGVLLVHVLRRQERAHAQFPMMPNISIGYPPMGGGWGAPAAALEAPAAPARMGSGPTMKTVTVPSASPVFLASASDVSVEVVIRPVTPVASFVALAYSAGALQSNSYQSDSVIVPVGRHQTIRLAPGQRLYGRAITPPDQTAAFVSVARSERSEG